jgi:hypothetical protein
MSIEEKEILAAVCLSLLYQKEVHSRIGNNDEDSGEDSESNYVFPEC